MAIDEKTIQDLVDKEDVGGLCDLAHECLESDRDKLYSAIESVLEVWIYDIYCGKLGDPADLPYLQGIEALEALGKAPLYTKRGEYLSSCFDFELKKGNLGKAKDYAFKSETELKKAIEFNDKNQIAYTHLIHLYRNFPTNENKSEEILKLLNKATSLSDSLYGYKLDTLFSYDFSEDVREVFLSECREKAQKDPLFALNLSQTYFHLLHDCNEALRSRLEKEFLKVIEASKSCLSSGGDFDFTSAGHFYTRVAEAYGRIDLYILAEELFKKALSLATAFPLMNTYIAKAKEGRAKLLDKANNPQEAENLRKEIREDYLDHWELFKNNLSYLAHSSECLLAFALSGPRSEVQRNVLEAIRSMSLASERLGEGHYWFPYSHLFWVNVLMNKDEEAKLWLARGYFALNILISDQLKKLLVEAKEKCSSDLIAFIEKLEIHLSSTPKDAVWRGGPIYKDISELTLKDFEAWLLQH